MGLLELAMGFGRTANEGGRDENGSDLASATRATRIEGVCRRASKRCNCVGHPGSRGHWRKETQVAIVQVVNPRR